MQIQDITYHGTQAIELKTAAFRLVATSEFGPRIAHLSKVDADNILLWDTNAQYTRGDWQLHGGHRVWVTRPMADECEDTYAPDNTACTATGIDNGFVLTGAISPLNNTQRSLRIVVTSENTLTVENILTNCGDMLYSGGIWSLTCTVPGDDTRYFVPVGNGGAWDSCRLILFRTWGGHDGGFNDDQFDFTDDLFVITPKGRENKRMLFAPRGVMAMSDPSRNLTFIKRTEYRPGMTYPLDANMAFYIGPNNFMVEMETMGPELTVAPGETISHTEQWELRDGAIALADWAQTV